MCLVNFAFFGRGENEDGDSELAAAEFMVWQGGVCALNAGHVRAA
jgi:hypothetical protein